MSSDLENPQLVFWDLKDEELRSQTERTRRGGVSVCFAPPTGENEGTEKKQNSDRSLEKPEGTMRSRFI